MGDSASFVEIMHFVTKLGHKRSKFHHSGAAFTTNPESDHFSGFYLFFWVSVFSPVLLWRQAICFNDGRMSETEIAETEYRRSQRNQNEAVWFLMNLDFCHSACRVCDMCDEKFRLKPFYGGDAQIHFLNSFVPFDGPALQTGRWLDTHPLRCQETMNLNRCREDNFVLIPNFCCSLIPLLSTPMHLSFVSQEFRLVLLAARAFGTYVCCLNLFCGTNNFSPDLLTYWQNTSVWKFVFEVILSNANVKKMDFDNSLCVFSAQP